MSELKSSTPISAFALFNKSKELVLKNPMTYAAVLLLPFLFNLATNARPMREPYKAVPGFGLNLTPAIFGFGIAFALLALTVFIVVTTMQYSLTLQSAKGSKPELDDLWPYVKKFWLRIFGLSLVIGLVVVLGLIAFIVPGLIFMRRYYLAPYIMIDKNLSITESMNQSAAMTKPYASSIWGLLGVTVLLSLPAIIPVFGWLISFALTTLYAAAPALRYVELKKLSS